MQCYFILSLFNDYDYAGFLIKVVNVERQLSLHFQELGGSEQIRLYWDRYYSGRDLIVSP